MNLTACLNLVTRVARMASTMFALWRCGLGDTGHRGCPVMVRVTPGPRQVR